MSTPPWIDNPNSPATDDTGGPVDDALPLPAFIDKRPEGLFVIPARISSEDDFTRFVDRLFSGGDRFAGLEYAVFLRLLYPRDEPLPAGPLMLAGAIVAFPEARRTLYKEVRFSPNRESAEYLFEPVAMEIVEQVPQFGPIREDSSALVTGYEEKVTFVPTRLDFDEFVAAMWLKGVRYGIDAAAVRQTIERGDTTRVEVARMLAPTPGCDAGIVEVSDALHRDDSPKVLSSGRHDLRQFANRYPQIAAGTALLKKIPRILGKCGYAVTGSILDPGPLPKDFDLNTLAGPGTRVERRDDGEYLAAIRDGFLSLDAATNQVSVTDKVINREGISLRTTGDLKLSGDEFESHGDVQERRVVEGRHMTFRGDVFGTVLSKGGDILIEGNIVGGKAVSPRGSVVITGRASQASVEAEGGEIRIKLAEGCSIIGTRVSVERAVNCEIIAETLEVEQMESCAVAARSMRVGVTSTRKEAENLLSVLVPELSVYHHRREQLNDEQAAADKALAEKRLELEHLKKQPDLAKYLALEAQLRKGEIQLTPVQKEHLQKAMRRFAPDLQQLRATMTEVQKLQEDSERLSQERHSITLREEAAVRDVACSIKLIDGETLVRRLTLPTPEFSLDALLVKEIRGRLRQFDKSLAPLFSGCDGAFEWRLLQDSE